MTYRVHTGIIAGRDHIHDVRNCQDALGTVTGTYRDGDALIGVIADGCSEGGYAEVGAQLAVQFILTEVKRLLKEDVELEALPQVLYHRVVEFLQTLVKSYHFADAHDMVIFVRDHLLFTIVGCVVTEEEALVFAAGDGVIILNEQHYILDQDNHPAYIGYHVIERSFLQEEASNLPTNFELYRLPAGETLQRLAIGSDAWGAEAELLGQIWGNRGRAELQLRLNRWSQARHLRDDASLIVLERLSV